MGNPSISPGRLDFPVDTMVLSGNAYLSDTQGALLPVAEKTEYITQPSTLARTTTDYFDFDGDGQNETVVKGYLKDVTNPDTGIDEKVFTTDDLDSVDAKEHLQGVYLSSGSHTPGEDAPDFTRAMDWSTNFKNEGMLKTISEDDLRNTDLYVFRLSDGKLISERLGLAPDDWHWSDDLGASAQNSTFFYHTYLRGYYGDLFRMTQGSYVHALNFGDWQAKSGINPALHQRQADHLKPGDRVELIAINRATGYMGSVQTIMRAAGSDGGLGRDLAWGIPPIRLQPPNLKIRVDRDYNIKEGLRKGEVVKDQIIGYEGAALSSDNMIALSTEWLKPDGTEFPVSADTATSDYGYTGRVAFLSNDNEIVSGSNVGVAQFPIKPGKHLQIIQLPNGANDNKHFYVQVSGEPATGNPIFSGNYDVCPATGSTPATSTCVSKTADFTSTGVHAGKLEKRPDKFVPFMVPVFDEQTSELQRQAYRQAAAANSGQTYEKPAPFYQWVYRPEFQYSLYDLSIDKINRYEKDATDGEDILNATQPIIASSDDLIEILYNLDINKYTPVDYFNIGEEKELIFAVGEQEIRAKINEKDTLEFTDLEHLASLDPEDFLTIRLYTNNDVGNVLWEYAFDMLALDTRIAGYDNQTDDTWYVTADDPTVPFQSILVGYAGRDQASKSLQTVKWSVSGIGTMNPVTTTDTDLGVFASDLTMPAISGMTGKVKATLVGATNTSAIFKTVEVLPGKPGNLAVTTTGEPSALGVGEMSVSVTVKDNHGNLVSDGTSVNFSIEGDALLSQYDTGTTSGKATATIQGTEIANPSNKLIVSVDALSYSQSFPVHPLTLTLDNFSPNQKVGQTATVSVTVTDYKGNIAPGIGVSFSSTYGTFKESLITTNSSGQASASLINPRSEGNGVLNLQVGHAGRVKQAYTVDYPTAQVRDLDTQNAMLVGDQTSAGHIEHERFDATKIGLDYKIEKPVRVLGSPGDTVNISLGNLQDPNIEPVAVFYMNELDTSSNGTQTAEDDTGLHNATAKYVSVMQQHPMGKGTSYYFSKGIFDADTNSLVDSYFAVPDIAALNQANNIGFRLDFKADETNAELFDQHSGAQRVTFNAGGQIEYRIQTDTGTYTITSAALGVDQWHSIAGRYYNNQLELMVNGQPVTPVPASGDLQYAGTSGIRVGNNYQGFMNSLRFYNWNAQPLTQFSNGQQSMAVVVDAAGYTDVVVRSTGQLNQLQSDSATQLLRVAIQGQHNREYISLLSSNACQQLASQYLNTLYSNAPPIKLTQSFNPQPYQGIAGLNFLIPMAQAGVFDFTLDDLYEGVSGAVNFLIPFESIGILVEQLTYLAKGDPNFDATELAFAALDLVTIIPIAKPLKPLLKPIKNFVKKFGKKPIVKAIAGVLGEAAEQAITSRKFDKFVSLLPYLLTVGEMLIEPGGMEAIDMMVEAIGSTDDLWAWIDYFNLPDGGWVGDIVPPINLTSVQPVEPELPFSWMIGKAYAAPVIKGLKVPVKKLVKSLTTVKSKLNLDADGMKNLTKGMKLAVSVLKKGGGKEVREIIFSPAFYGFITRKARHGYQGLADFLSGKTSSRIHPIIVVASVVYLETEMSSGGIPDKNNLHERIRGSLYGDAFTAVLLNKDKLTNKAHGGMYHLLSVAYLHLLHQNTGTPGLKAVEAKRWMHLYEDDGFGSPSQYTKKPFERNVDIVLEDGTNEQWWELKSYKGGGNFLGRYTNWKGISKDSTVGKEIVLDRSAKYFRDGGGESVVEGLTEENPSKPRITVTVDSIDWRFQQFKTTSPIEQGYTKTEFGSTGGKEGTVLYKLASINCKVDFVVTSVGLDSACENDPKQKLFRTTIGLMAKRDTLLNKIIDQLLTYGGGILDGIDLSKYKDITLDSL